jgi:hypothetical protein
MCEACDRGVKLVHPHGKCTDCEGELYPTGMQILTAAAPVEFKCIGCGQTFCIPENAGWSDRLHLPYFPFLKDRLDKRQYYDKVGQDGG